jgi:hypothetical protein
VRWQNQAMLARLVTEFDTTANFCLRHNYFTATLMSLN